MTIVTSKSLAGQTQDTNFGHFPVLPLPTTHFSAIFLIKCLSFRAIINGMPYLMTLPYFLLVYLIIFFGLLQNDRRQ